MVFMTYCVIIWVLNLLPCFLFFALSSLSCLIFNRFTLIFDYHFPLPGRFLIRATASDYNASYSTYFLRVRFLLPLIAFKAFIAFNALILSHTLSSQLNSLQLYAFHYYRGKIKRTKEKEKGKHKKRIKNV